MIVALGWFIGACLGSFVTLLADRYPRARWHDVLRERSACVVCKHPLFQLDLIPIFSWFFLKGKCRYCQQPIGIYYPLLELIAGITVTLSFFIPATLSAMLLSLLSLLAIYIARVDWRLRILPLPSLMLMAMLGAGWVFNHSLFVLPSILLGMIGLACQRGYLWATSRSGLGVGDVLLLSICGLFLTLEQIPFFLILTGTQGAILGLIWLKIYNKRYFPLSPAILSSLLLVMFYSFLMS